MKTKEELNALKNEVETLNKKLHELTDEELAEVTGGDVDIRKDLYENVILSGMFAKMDNVIKDIDHDGKSQE